MKRVLVLGAGQSTPYLIRHLLDACDSGWRVIVADQDILSAQTRIDGHPRGEAVVLDARDKSTMFESIRSSNVVVNFLAPAFQVPIAKVCLEAKRSMVSASYRADQLLALDAEARSHGLVFASEMGLDPGLDHMSAMRLLDGIRAQGGRIREFWSFGGGLPEHPTANPLGYVVTWNPRNVVMSGEGGAQFLYNGRKRIVPYSRLFEHTWRVDTSHQGNIEGSSSPRETIFEAYPNRDSLSYIDVFGLGSVRTMVRATLRYPGFCETWSAIARLGLANEHFRLDTISDHSWRDLISIFLPDYHTQTRDALARYLGIHRTSRAIENLEWLGLLDDQPIREFSAEAARARYPAHALITLLKKKLELRSDERDRVILHHRVHADMPKGSKIYSSSLDVLGSRGGMTAMAKTVGLPAALATLDIARDAFPVLGCPLPVESQIYNRYLPKVEEQGIIFHEAVSE